MVQALEAFKETFIDCLIMGLYLVKTRSSNFANFFLKIIKVG